MNKRIAVLVLGLVLFPLTSHAQTTDDALRQQIAALQVQIADLIQQIALLNSKPLNSKPMNTDSARTPKLGAASAFSFTVEPTATKESLELRTSTVINEAHICYSLDGGAQQCSMFGAPLEKGEDFSVFGWDEPTPGTYQFTLTGYQYGASGKFEGAKTPGDWKSAQVTGSFVVE